MRKVHLASSTSRSIYGLVNHSFPGYPLSLVLVAECFDPILLLLCHHHFCDHKLFPLLSCGFGPKLGSSTSVAPVVCFIRRELCCRGSAAGLAICWWSYWPWPSSMLWQWWSHTAWGATSNAGRWWIDSTRPLVSLGNGICWSFPGLCRWWRSCVCQPNQSQSLPRLQTSCSASNGILSLFTVKKIRSFLAPFWIEKLRDLAGLILILAHVMSSSSLLRSQAVQALLLVAVVSLCFDCLRVIRMISKAALKRIGEIEHMWNCPSREDASWL